MTKKNSVMQMASEGSTPEKADHSPTIMNVGINFPQVRGDLFPPSKAAELGLDPANFVIIEVEHATQMYNSVSEYIADKGVDLDAELNHPSEKEENGGAEVDCEHSEKKVVVEKGEVEGEKGKEEAGKEAEQREEKDEEKEQKRFRLSSLRTCQARAYFGSDSESEYSSDEDEDGDSEAESDDKGVKVM